jgi:hypothetical protein
VHPDAPYDARRAVVERALTFYFYADHAWGELLFGGKVRDAAPTETAENQEDQWSISVAWARMLWSLRPLLGPEGTGRALAQAWMDASERAKDFYRAYAGQVVTAVGTGDRSDQREAVRAVFAEKGIAVRG